jgi:hypothetical protein
MSCGWIWKCDKRIETRRRDADADVQAEHKMSMTLNEIWPGPPSPVWELLVMKGLARRKVWGSEQDWQEWPWDWTGSCPECPPNEGRRHLSQQPTAQPTPLPVLSVVFRLLCIPTFIPLVNTIVFLAPLPQSPISVTHLTLTHTYRPICPPASSKWADQAALALRSSSLSSWVCLISLPTHSDFVY